MAQVQKGWRNRRAAARTLLAALGLGAAFTALADGSDGSVEHCPKKLGTVAVVEPQGGWGYLQSYGLGSPAALLRTMIQQSACFDVVERGAAMQNLAQERALMENGELRSDSTIGKGQMQVADFVLTPTVQVGSSDTGGLGASLLSGLGRLGNAVGSVAGGLKFKEAETSITVSDVRSSIQIASAQGKASKTDFNLGAWAGGSGTSGGLNGYTNSPEGRMVASSFLDNYNRIVLSIRSQNSLIKPASTESSMANAGGSTKAEAPQKSGEVLLPKIANVKVYKEPTRDSKVLATLPRGEELVATGEMENGFVQIDAANVSGWVQRTLVAPAGGYR